MDPKALEELSRLILEGQVHLVGKVYLYMALTAFLLLVCTGFLGAYLKRRGENYATKTDFRSLLEQLKQTTEVAEQVKAKISHEDWRSREARTVYRDKLEELLGAMHDLVEWQQAAMDAALFQGPPPGRSPLSTVERIVTLYFPGLRASVLAFCQTHRKQNLVVLATQKKLLAVKEPTEKPYHLDSCSKEWMELHIAQGAELWDVEKEARKLMAEIVGA